MVSGSMISVAIFFANAAIRSRHAVLYIWYIVFSPDEDEDELDEDEETRILLEKEFDDFYEDQVLKNQTHFPRRLCASKLN